MMPLSGRFAATFPRWSCQQLFSVATQVERYPEFISWCKSCKVLSEDGGERMVDNHFGAGPAIMHFLSRAVADEPHRLDIAAVDGPFHRFRLIWHFTPTEQGGCRVEAEYEVAFRSPMLQGLARLTVGEVERRILRKFEERAAELYGA